jgi:hypothetical protein
LSVCESTESFTTNEFDEEVLANGHRRHQTSNTRLVPLTRLNYVAYESFKNHSRNKLNITLASSKITKETFESFQATCTTTGRQGFQSQPFKAFWLRVAPTGLKLYALLTMYHLNLFCILLRTNSDLCHLHHKLIGFYNRDGKCLQRGTNWGFK